MNVFSIFQNKQSTAKLSAPGDAHTPRISSITWPDGGWEPAGYTIDGSYVVLSRKTGQLVILRAQDLTEKKLLVLLGQQARNDHMDFDSELKKDVFSLDGLVGAISSRCDAMGPFDLARVRGSGLYREGDDLVINFGEEVASVDGRGISTVPVRQGVAYQCGPSLGFSLDTPCASNEEIQRVVEAVGSFGLRRAGDAVLLLGWLAMAFFGQVLTHRPILAITAERGSGKTTLIEFLSQLLGPQAMRRDGVPTEAQVIYELEKKSAALFVDELEARRSKLNAVESFLETIRIGFTNSSENRISRVLGGKQRYFAPPAGVLVAGIGLPAFNPATESRTVRVCLDALSPESQERYQPFFDPTKQCETVAVGARLRRLLTTRWSVMRETMEAVRPMLIGLGHEARTADKYAPLISGYVALMHSSVPSAEELRQLIELLELLSPPVVTAERDADVCLRVLLGRKIAVFKSRDGERVKAHMTIREVISQVVHGDDQHRKPLTLQLEEFGIRPIWVKEDACWTLAICASEQHDGMRRLMQRTDWALGGWKDVLLRLPGAKACVQKVAKVPQRVVAIDMPGELLVPTTEEVYDFPC